jgi:hypothetical protein
MAYKNERQGRQARVEGALRHCTGHGLRRIHLRQRAASPWQAVEAAPRQLYSGPRVNFEFNPNVAPTETVPVLIAGTVLSLLALVSTKSAQAANPVRRCSG